MFHRGRSGVVSLIDILHPKPGHFHQSHSRAVKDVQQEKIPSCSMFKKAAYFTLREHHRQFGPAFRPHGFAEILQVYFENLSKQKEQCVICLILSGRRHPLFDRQVAEKIPDIRLISTLSFPIFVLYTGQIGMKTKKRACIRPFRAVRVMLDSKCFTDFSQNCSGIMESFFIDCPGIW
ncbi:MAG TPA: hypothetical protein PKL38_11600 [Smithella sp.]|nr:hypothetical protein [Smithella sp.]